MSTTQADRTATLTTTATAGRLQVLAAEHGLWGSPTQGRHCTWTVLTNERHGPVEMRATRDALRRAGERAWITVGQ